MPIHIKEFYLVGEIKKEVPIYLAEWEVALSVRPKDLKMRYSSHS